jgi:lipoyl-dependent peroxiredoxin
MADILRVGEAVWSGDLRSGNGTLGSESGVLKNTPYSFATRFGDAKGTNPEELIAAAHAACYSMALANYLSSKGHTVRSIATKATCTLSQQAGGFRITRMRLDTTGDVPGLTADAFEQLAREGEKTCPVSNSIRGCVEIELHARLL